MANRKTMNELIKVTQNEQGSNVVSARELYEFLEVKTEFSKWCTRMFEYGFEENKDFNLVKIDGVQLEGSREVKRELIDYALTLDTSKEIAMLQRSEKGKEARKYFIECERKLKETFSIPQTFSEALRLASEQAETIEKQQLLISEQTPKVEAFDRVLDGSTTYTLDTVSDILNIGRTKLSAKLKSIGWSMKDSTFGTASTRKAEEAENAKTYFENITLGNKELKVKKIVITKKGLDYLVNNYSSIFE